MAEISSQTTTSTALFFDFIKYFGPKMYNLKIYDKEWLIQLFCTWKGHVFRVSIWGARLNWAVDWVHG